MFSVLEMEIMLIASNGLISGNVMDSIMVEL